MSHIRPVAALPYLLFSHLYAYTQKQTHTWGICHREKMQPHKYSGEIKRKPLIWWCLHLCVCVYVCACVRTRSFFEMWAHLCNDCFNCFSFVVSSWNEGLQFSRNITHETCNRQRKNVFQCSLFCCDGCNKLDFWCLHYGESTKLKNIKKLVQGSVEWSRYKDGNK